jgi:hypothetical protein
MTASRASRRDAIAAKIRRLKRSPLRAGLAAWRWHGAGCDLEALAALEDARASPLKLRAMFALGLHRSFLEALDGRDAKGWLTPARGIARLATGDAGAAAEDLRRAIGKPADFGLWLRAAASLAQIDGDAVRQMLDARREPAAVLLQTHLRLRGGDAGESIPAGLHLAGRRAAEVDLLEANLATARGNSDAAEDAFARALSRSQTAAGKPAEEPLISVIVAAYNAEKTIAKAVNSLRIQHWRNLEIIVIDDASSDATAERVEAIAKDEPRLRLLRQPANAGAYAARNLGLSAARGDFVAFHDADDIALPERLLQQVQPLLADPGLVFTTARWVRRDAKGLFVNRQIAPLIRQHVGSFLVRRSDLAAIGAFDPVRFGGDGEMLLRLKLAAGPSRHRALAAPLTIGGYDSGSAVHDPDTGYGSRGYAPARLDYVEQSTWRLIESLRQGT